MDDKKLVRLIAKDPETGFRCLMKNTRRPSTGISAGWL